MKKMLIMMGRYLFEPFGFFKADISVEFYFKYKDKVKWENLDFYKYSHESPILNGSSVPKYLNISSHLTTNKRANSIGKQLFLDGKIESFEMLKMNF